MASTFRKVVVKYLSKFGHITPVESLACPGIPDVNYCISGHEGWIELKETRDLLRPSQKLWLSNHFKHGGIAWVLYRSVAGNYLLTAEDALRCERSVDYVEDGIKMGFTLVGLEKWITNSEMVTEYYRQQESR